MGTQIADEKQSILDNLSESWKPKDIRELAATLLRLADAFDQDWDDSSSASIFRWPSTLNRIERNAFNLSLKAKNIYDLRRQRSESLPIELMSEPAWDMLLELFMQFAGGAKVSTSSLCIASNCPQSTALRYLAQLEDAGLVTRCEAVFDKRVQLVALSERGVVGMGTFLERI